MVNNWALQRVEIESVRFVVICAVEFLRKSVERAQRPSETARLRHINKLAR